MALAWRPSMGPRRPDDRRAAVQATVSVTGAVLLVVLLDRTAWTAYAAFGAFAATYGRGQPPTERLRRQALGALLLVTCVTAGAAVGTLADRDWWLVLGGGVVAAIGSAVVALEEWRPPGPVFLVFGFGAVASVPQEPGSVPVALAVSAASAGFAFLVGNGATLLRRTPHRPVPLRRRLTWHPALAGLAVVLAGGLSTLLGIGHPYWSMVAAVAVVAGRDRRHRWERALHRVGGTLAGLVVAAGLLVVVDDPLVAVLAVGVLQLLTELVVTRHYALALLFITPLALLMGQLAAPRPVGSLLLDRGVETVVGAVVALLVGLAGGRLLRAVAPRG